jgi:UDP-N-acetyl-D-mannosaminuronic acid dehydrogenase
LLVNIFPQIDELYNNYSKDKASKMNINVIGLGYVGLPLSVMLAHTGNKVTGTDINEQLIDRLKNSDYRYGDDVIDKLLLESTNNNLHFSSKASIADFHFVAVPTPFLKSTKKIDKSYLIQAINQILTLEQNVFNIVIESTVSPGTINALKLEFDFTNRLVNFIHSPERILPGDTYNEFINNSRTIGSDNNEVARLVESLYTAFVKGRIVHTDIITSELSKVVENSFRDVNIAFANEVAIISHELGIDVRKLIDICNLHPRVNILNPGPGVGGHCIPVDPWFLVGDHPNITNLIAAARKTNDYMPLFVYKRLKEYVEEYSIDHSRIGLYGMTYKANISDTRESPSEELYRLISTEFPEPFVFDPMLVPIHLSQSIEFNNFLNQVDLIIILVDHNHIKINANKLNGKVVFDTKRCVETDGVVYL